MLRCCCVRRHICALFVVATRCTATVCACVLVYVYTHINCCTAARRVLQCAVGEWVRGRCAFSAQQHAQTACLGDTVDHSVVSGQTRITHARIVCVSVCVRLRVASRCAHERAHSVTWTRGLDKFVAAVHDIEPGRPATVHRINRTIAAHCVCSSLACCAVHFVRQCSGAHWAIIL